MFSNGYFIGGGSVGSSSSESNDVIVVDGDVFYNPLDSIYIDDNENVYMDKENENAIINLINGEIFAEKVV